MREDCHNLIIITIYLFHVRLEPPADGKVGQDSPLRGNGFHGGDVPVGDVHGDVAEEGGEVRDQGELVIAKNQRRLLRQV